MNTLYFIAGASGSGKTAIMSDLEKKLGNAISVYDFDDIGVPDGADKKWRQETTERWLEKLLKEKKDACLLGQMVLGEILACPSAAKIDKINFCLLDVSDIERIKRLKNRNTYGADQNMLNWSAWLRMHHHEPQWAQQVIKEECWDGLNFSCWDQLTSWNSKSNIEYLDTTELSINKVAESIADWINTKNEEPILFNLADGLYQLQHSTNDAYEYILAESLKHDERILPFTQTPKRIEINFVVMHQGDVIGGIYADLYHWNILYICILFVSETHRNKKLGSILLNHAEETAKSMGCTLCHVETYDFQAEDFYIKHGYEVFGTLENCPKGHKRFYLRKNLTTT
ncbi:MAG: GNAT family N-acetyltransferase [Gammaproteobacteria bacterium]